MNWRCLLMGHEHRFRAAVVRRVERAGITEFRCWHVERCYRCPDEKQTELPQACTAGEVVKLFDYKSEVIKPDIADRRYGVTLDGRPMGHITLLNNTVPNGWTAARSTGAIAGQNMTKEEAAAALW